MSDLLSKYKKPFWPQLWRRLFHITAGSSIPIIGLLVNESYIVVLLATLAGLAIGLELLRFAIPGLNRSLMSRLRYLFRPTEANKVTGATYMAIASLAAFLFFEKGVAVAALLFNSVGDPLAGLVGSKAGGPRLFGKSWQGTGAYLLAAVVVAYVLFGTGQAGPFWVLLVGAAVAALTELLPLPVDDNVSVPLVSGAMMALLG